MPEAPVGLNILVDGVSVGCTVANLFRADLAEAGLGSGCHAFAFTLPPGAGDGVVGVRRVGDHATLGPVLQRRQVAA